MRAYYLQSLILIATLAVMCGCATYPASVSQQSGNEEATSGNVGHSQARLIDVNSYVTATGDETFTVCTSPRPMVYGERDANYAVLRMAPYRACQGVSRRQISRRAYRAFSVDYPDLLLLVESIKSLTQLEMDTTTAPHREAIEALATENAALKLMCAHPGLFAVDAGVLDLCIAGLLNKEASLKNDEGRTD